jgi:hypothetical protein
MTASLCRAQEEGLVVHQILLAYRMKNEERRKKEEEQRVI